MKYSLLILFSFFTLQLLAQSYTNVEGAEYDAAQNRFIISNGNSILQRASDGTLSFFGSGSISNGLEIMNGTLYGVQGSTVKAFDLTTEMEIMTLSIPGASFLNGLTNDGNNKLWAADFSGSKIYEIDVTDINNPTFTIVVSNTGSTPNGILYDGNNNRLLYVNWGGNAPIKAVSLTDYSVTTVAMTSLGNIDGIDEDNNNNILVSHWSPAGITKFDANLSNPVSVTVPGIFNPADICYAKEIDTLAIPNDGDDVLFVGFSDTTPVGDIVNEDYQFSMGPNPMLSETIIQFHLPKSEDIILDIYSIDGKKIKSLIQHKLIEGWHKVLLTGIDLDAGIYVVHMETSKGIISDKLIVK